MKSTTFVLGAFLASVAVAQPHKPHHARHHKRQNVETTVIVTDWVTDYETVGVTTTIWVSPGFVEPEVTSSTSPSTTTIPKVSSSITPTAAQFFEPETTSSTKKAAPTPSSSSTSSTPSPVYVAPTTSTASSVYVAPVVESSSSSYVAPVVVPTTTSPAAVQYTAPAETTTSIAAPAATTASSNTVSNSGYSGSCSSGSPCTGDITFYEAGLGACGITNDGSTEKVVALPWQLMGTQSNGNPYCGKTITISYGGKTTTATVTDKCMGCEGDSIDLSNAAFLELADFALGRGHGATWHFN